VAEQEGTTRVAKERVFHKDLSVRIHRKRLFRKSEWCRAVLKDIGRTGARLLTREPMLEGYQLCIGIVDPETERERELTARVARVVTIDYHGKRLFELHVEFVKLSRNDLVMLENLFYI
jgi:hypothetical protein